MKTWYLYSDRKNKFVQISKSDLVSCDIVCCKTDEGFIHMDNSSVFVVINPNEDNSQFRLKSLMAVLGAIKNTYMAHGIYFLPDELDQYLTGNDLNEELVDENWGFLQFRPDAKTWYDFAMSRLDDIMVKNLSK